MWAESQRPTVLVIFSEDGYRGSVNYQLDLKFPPQYIPKQYRYVNCTGTSLTDFDNKFDAPQSFNGLVISSIHRKSDEYYEMKLFY